MFEAVDDLAARVRRPRGALADPAIHADQATARAAGPAVRAAAPGDRDVPGAGSPSPATWRRRRSSAGTTRRSGPRPPSCCSAAHELADRLHTLLIPRDPLDDSDVILEVKAGEGGDESALFAADLLRMYLRYAERRGWKTEVLEAERVRPRRLQGRDGRGEGAGDVEPGEAPYARLKYEGGVHRVQRVPATESQGRIHTRAAGVLVLPEAEDVEVEIDPNDLRIDVYRSIGPGGQSVNTTDSAVRITHLPTGRSSPARTRRASCRTRSRRMRILRARLLAAGAGGGRRRRRPTPAVPRSARSTAASGSAPTTSPRTASATTGSATRRTTSTRSWTATSSRVMQACADADAAPA